MLAVIACLLITNSKKNKNLERVNYEKKSGGLFQYLRKMSLF